MDGDEFQPYALNFALPVGVMPGHGVGIVTYLDAEGTERWALTMEGEASLTSLLGLLELAKVELHRQAEEW